MRAVWLTITGVLLAAVFFTLVVDVLYEERAFLPAAQAGQMPFFEDNQLLNTVNTTRVGTDDPIETAVAVSQIVYAATEEENTPGAVVLVNRGNLAEVMLAASRVQHFPVNAPLLYVDEDSIPPLTRDELLRLKPEGVPVDGNVQVYLVGTIGDQVRREVEELGFRVRAFTGPDPIALSEALDDWTSTLHGDHRNDVVVANLDDLEPAIPSAFWNAHAGDGLVFVTDRGVPEATRRMLLRRANGPWMYVFGDESVVSERTVRDLAQYGQVTRIPRRDLPAASAYFAGFKDQGANWGAWVIENARAFGWGLAEAGHNAIFVNTTGPGGWQNAIVATTLSHMGKHAPVLVVGQSEVPEAVASYLRIIKPYPTAPRQQLLNHGWIVGGAETIGWETQATLDLMLEGHMAIRTGG